MNCINCPALDVGVWSQGDVTRQSVLFIYLNYEARAKVGYYNIPRHITISLLKMLIG